MTQGLRDPPDLGAGSRQNAGMTASPAVPVILDGDPGHDDAINFLLALASPEFQVLGLTTVFGNVGLEHNPQRADRARS